MLLKLRICDTRSYMLKFNSHFLKPYNIAILFIISAMIFTGCGTKNVTNCRVLSVDGSTCGSNYVCRNDMGTYVYKNNAIYDTDTDQPLAEVTDLVCMAAAQTGLYFYTSEDGGSLYRYQFENGTISVISKDYCVAEMKAHNDDVFITVRDKDYKNYKEETYSYELLLFGADGEKDNLTVWAETQEPAEEYGDYEVYAYGDYLLTADLSLTAGQLQFVYIEASDFAYSCLPYNVYAKIDGSIVSLEKYLPGLPEVTGGEGGISPALTEFCDGCFYMLVQYSRGTWAYQENPTIDFKVRDVYYKYDPAAKEFELLYEAGRKEQIAGFFAEQGMVYLLRKDGVYAHDLQTGEETWIAADPFAKDKYGTMIFDFYGGDLYIFSQAFGADSPVMEVRTDF